MVCLLLSATAFGQSSTRPTDCICYTAIQDERCLIALLEVPKLQLLVQELEAQRAAERDKAAANAMAASKAALALHMCEAQIEYNDTLRRSERWRDRFAGAGGGAVLVLVMVLLL